MRHHLLSAALLASATLSGMFTLSGCQEQPVQIAAASGGQTLQARQGRPAQFLARGTCAGRGRGRPAFEEVDCASDEATASVLARYNGPQASGPRCPDDTDFVLHIAAVDTGTSEQESSPEGYACMRNLRPPHPGDPGMGGGPLTVAGDCVYTEHEGVVKETACDGSTGHAPEYRVEETVPTRDDCPEQTDLYVDVGGRAPVGCARRLS